MKIEERIRGSFAKQGLMRTLGAEVASAAPGSVEIVLRPDGKEKLVALLTATMMSMAERSDIGD